MQSRSPVNSSERVDSGKSYLSRGLGWVLPAKGCRGSLLVVIVVLWKEAVEG